MLRLNQTSERALLHLCSKSIDNYYLINSKVNVDDLQDDKHKLIYTLMTELANEGVSELTSDQVYSKATQKEILDDIGGYKYLKAVIEGMKGIGYTLENISKHIDTVLEISKAVKLRSLLESRTKELNRENITDVIDTTIKDLLDLNNASYIGKMKAMSDHEFMNEYIQTLDEKPINMCGIPTGYEIFDKQIDGLIPGTLTIIAAEKKAGKSTLLTNISDAVATNSNIPVLYIDTEMSDYEWQYRLIAKRANIEERKMKHKDLTTYEKERIIEIEKSHFDCAKIYHQYLPGYNVDQIVSIVNRYYRKEKIGLVVFDYIKEPSDTGSSRRNEYQILGDVTTKLKDLAGSLNIPILTAAQLNRSGSIADSYRILWFADVICYWQNRTDDEKDVGGELCGTHKLIIRDSRRGGSTSEEGIGYYFFKKTLTIKEVPLDKQYFFMAGND